MRTATAQDAAHVLQDTTYWTLCIKVSRGDSEVVRMTSLDREVAVALDVDTYSVNGTYLPLSTFDATSLRSAADLSVDNGEIQALHDDAGINEQDIRTGQYHDARYVLFLVNWKDPTNSGLLLKRGTVGYVTDFAQDVSRIELRGLTQYLQQTITEAVSPTCRYVLGDDRCTVDLGAFTYAGEVTGVAIQRRQIESLITGVGSPEPPEPSGAWFTGGRLTWLTGSNAGLISEIKLDAESGDLTLLELTPYDISITDTFTITPGCDHAHSVTDGVASGDCHNKYDNAVNFGGEFNVPSQYSLVEAPD